jgi:hypothetical protein
MKLYSQLGFYLWCAQPLLQGAVAAIMWRRKLNKLFPVFFTYIVVQIGIFAVTFPLRSAENYEWYFYAYWLGAAMNALLSFRIIHEIFLDVFRPYQMLKDLGTVLFKWTGLVMLLVSVIVAFSNSAHGDPLSQAVTLLQRSVRMVQCGLILFLLLFSQFLGVSRKQQSFGIAFGFGLIASVELILLTLYAGGYLSGRVMNLTNTLTFDLAIVIWMAYSLARSAAREVAPNHLKTQRWERSLADLQTPIIPAGAATGALIPMFEGMVERAFSRGSNLEEPSERAAAARAGFQGRS